jgi:hypothetical protein
MKRWTSGDNDVLSVVAGSRLQAFCKHRASAAMSPCSAQMHGRGRNWLRFCIPTEYRGTRASNRGGS